MSTFLSTNLLQNYILQLSFKISKVSPKIRNANKVTENILTCSRDSTTTKIVAAFNIMKLGSDFIFFKSHVHSF